MTDWKNRITETVEMKPADLQANPKNWRKHPTHQQKAMQGILDEVGWVAQIIWNKQTGHLIDGHLRVEMALRNKESYVPVNVVDLTPEEEILILSTFDPIGAMAETDKEMLEELMKAIESENEAINQMIAGIAAEERIDMGGDLVEAPEPQIDQAAELQAQWGTARGQLWQCGDHRVLCGDSTNAGDVARLMGGGMADLVLTDPPYGIDIVNADRVGIDAQAGFGKVGTRGLVKARTYQKIEGDDRPFDPRPFLDLAPVVMLFGANNFSSKLPDSPAWLVWDKKAEKGADHNNFSDVELVWTNLKQKSCPIYRHLWSGLLREGDRDIELKDRVHPTQKPVGLIAAILTDFSTSGQSILDPFLGSGTTMIACEQLGRRCFGIEISPVYTAVILQRFYDMTGKAPVLLEEAEA